MGEDVSKRDPILRLPHHGNRICTFGVRRSGDNRAV
jgi:hypothetical protein